MWVRGSAGMEAAMFSPFEYMLYVFHSSIYAVLSRQHYDGIMDVVAVKLTFIYVALFS